VPRACPWVSTEIFSYSYLLNNLEESRLFYESVFDLKFCSKGGSKELKYKFINLENENHNASELFKHEMPLPLKENLMNFQNVGIKHIAFVVDNIEAVIDSALAHGGKMI